MRRSFNLEPDSKYFFTVGSSDINLILRDCSETITLESDYLNHGIELSRSDILETNAFQNKQMWFKNKHKKNVFVEFQLVEARVYIKSENINNGEIIIDEISTPVKISEVQTPVNIGNLPEVQTIKSQNKKMMTAKNIILDENIFIVPANQNRDSILIQASYSNDAPISANGFLLIAGGFLNFNVQSEIYINGLKNLSFNYSEVLNV